MQCIVVTEKRPWWHKLLWHNWECIDDNGFTSYFECWCGARKVFQRNGGYQPVDWKWVVGRTKKLWSAKQLPPTDLSQNLAD